MIQTINIEFFDKKIAQYNKQGFNIKYTLADP